MAVSFQIPHQPCKGKLFHHLLLHGSGNLKTKQNKTNLASGLSLSLSKGRIKILTKTLDV